MKLSKFLIICRMLPPGAGWAEFHTLARILEQHK